MKKMNFTKFCGDLTFAALLVAMFGFSQISVAQVTCAAGTGAPAAFESNGFEAGIGSWVQDAGDDFNWTVDANGTTSGNTGPSSAIEGNNYLYIETSGPATGAIANIMFTADLIPSATLNGPFALEFQRHMFGATMGTLNVDISTDGGTTWTNELTVSGDQGDVWVPENIDLAAYTGNSVLIRFQGIRGTSFTGDLAIDAVSVFGCAPPCEIICEPDMNVNNDPGVCDAAVTVVSPTPTGPCVAQVPVQSADFTGGLPAGWSTNILRGANDWNVGAPAGFTAWDGDMMWFNDDLLGNGTDNAVEALTAPVDVSANALVLVEFEYAFQQFGATFLQVEVWDGAAWQVILTETATVGTNVPFSFDASAFANADFQVRFVYDDGGNGWGWWAGIDNFAVLVDALPQASHDSPYGASPVDASGTYPLGTTTITWTIFDEFGNPVTCTQDITVVDAEAPVITVDGNDCANGIADFVVDLGPGDCEAVVNFDVQATDNCPLIAPTINIPTPEVTPVGVATTGGGQGGVMFDIANTSATDITIASMDVVLAAGTWQFQVYSTAAASTYAGNENNGTPAASNANWNFHGQTTVTSAGDNTFTTIALVTPAVIPAGATLGFYLTEDDTGFGGAPIVYHFSTQPQSYGDANLTLTAGVGRTLIGGPFAGGIFGNGSGTNFRRAQISLNYSLPFDPGMQTAGIASGDAFPIGTTVNTFEAFDVAGNLSTCNFNVVVNEFANAVTTLACNDNIQVSLDEDCSSVVGADMVLEGGPYGCYDDYVVDVLTATGGSLGNTVDASFIGNTWTVKVTDPDTGNSCWGSLTVEDKLNPTVDCTDENLFACDGIVLPVTTPPTPVMANASDAPGLPIDNPFGDNIEFSTELEISGVDPAAIVTDLSVSVQITHTWVADIELYLIGPNGQEITLIAGQCTNGDNIDVTFNDAGVGLSCNGAAPAITGTMAPEEPLATFNNLSANGIWTLRLVDNFPNADQGTLDSWSIAVTSQEQFILAATAADNCGVASLTYIDNLVNGDCGGPAGTITRTWTATDNSGNTGSCEQTITLDRPTLGDVSFPGDATFDCASPEAADWYVDEQEGGVPTIAGQDVTSGDLCDISCEVSEETTLDVCEGTLKILRTWTCVDWCAGASESSTQILKLLDDQGPAVSSPAELTIDVYDASAPASSVHDVCAGHVVIPPAATTGDNCSGVASWITQLWAVDANCDPIELIQVIETNGGIFWDVALLANGVPARYQVVYRATDGCGNESETATCITTVDKVPPVAICDEITEITVTNNGATGEGCSTLFAEDLDDGSYDNCKPVWFLMAKMSEAPFSQDLLTRCFYPSRDFCCDEVGTTQQVILLVLDADPSALFFNLNQPFIGCDGTPGLVGTALQNSNINYNTCMVEVIVDDKLPPINTFCPGPQTITCDQYWDDYEAGLLLCEQEPNEDECQDNFLATDFGTPVFYDNCAVNVTPNVTVNIDQCGDGTIVRSWSAVDDVNNGPATCTQTIFVEHVSDWAVMFPDDKFVDCGVDVPEFGEPTLYHETCELLAVSYEDELFTTVPDACYKLVRQWTVINWCTVGNDIDQEIVEPSECDSGIDYNGNGINCALNAPIGNNGTIIGHGHRTFREDANTPDGYITYQQVIKVNDTVEPVFNDCSIEDMCIFDGCTMTVTLPQPDVSDCSENVTITVESTTLPGGANGFGPYTNVGPGTYNVVYKATDNCGNWSVCETDFSVEDCKNPTPYCVDGLNIEIMNTPVPMVDVWASDFDAGSFDNCQVVCIAFEATCPTPNNPTDQLVFGCDQVGEQLIQLWVYDGVNWDFCETFVNIQDNMVNCGGDDPQVQGNIATETNEDVAGVEVQVNSSNFNSMYTTDATGMFSVDVPAGGDYSITPVKDVNPLNGVTTFDLVQISKHILNIDMLDTPYQMIAADANKSGGITTFDMVQVRKLILYIDSEFANNTSWRFVPKSYEFTDASNPFADNFPEVINLNNVSLDQLAQDFVAIKIGDVNGSANTNNLLGADDRNFNGALTLNTEDIKVEAGKTYTVEFTANNFNHFGYQFTLNYNGLEFVEVGAGMATAENFGTSLVSENAITASWNKADAVSLSSDEAVFTLAFTANTTAQLSDLLSIDSRYTAAESYASNGDIQDVNLEFNGTVVANGFELFQNTPNPFSDATVIGFSLPTATTATITISDISGRVLKTIEGDFAKGYNQVDVTREGIPASGVLYYQLDTDTDSATKKMILID